MQSQNERDLEGLAARRDRDRDRDRSVDDFVPEEITGRYEGEELELARAKRPPDERFSHLEKKHDEFKRVVEKKHDEFHAQLNETRTDVKKLSSQVGDTRTEIAETFGDLRSDVSGAVGKLEGQEKVLHEVLGIVKKSAEVRVIRQHAEIEVERAHALATVEVTKEQQLDAIDAKKSRRKLILKGLGLIASGGGLIEILHRMGVL